MSEARYCQACGIKVWAGRDQCPRCNGALTVLPAAVRPPSETDRRRVIIAVVVIVVGIGTAVFWPRPAPPPDLAQPVPEQPATARGSQGRSPAAVVPAADEAQPGTFEPPFLNPSGAGNLAYGRSDYEGALAAYRKAIETNPDDAESLSNMGQVLVRLGRVPDAVPLFERAVSIQPSRWAYHFNLARAFGELNDWDKAVAEYRVAQQLFPDDYVTEFNLGRALHKQGNEDAAVRSYLRAIELAPGDPAFRLSLGISYERLGRAADAVKAYQEYLALAPDAPDAASVKARIDQLARNPSAPEAARPPGAAPGR